MSKQFLVVEIIDPLSVTGVQNVWVPVDADVHAVANGFKSLRDSGQKTTGAYSFAERLDDGTVRRIEKPVRRIIEGGFRTMSAFLRA